MPAIGRAENLRDCSPAWTRERLLLKTELVIRDVHFHASTNAGSLRQSASEIVTNW
jgi:hypothetical protein